MEKIETIVKAAETAVKKYGADHIDAVADEKNGISIAYHSHNNSFTVANTGVRTGEIDASALRGELDKLGVGYDF